MTFSEFFDCVRNGLLAAWELPVVSIGLPLVLSLFPLLAIIRMFRSFVWVGSLDVSSDDPIDSSPVTLLNGSPISPSKARSCTKDNFDY